MNLKVPKKTNSFLVWSFNDILTVLLPLWLLCLISEFRYAPIDSFFAAPFYLSGNNWFGTGSFFFSAVCRSCCCGELADSFSAFLFEAVRPIKTLPKGLSVRRAFYFGLCAHHQRFEVLIRLSMSLVASAVRRKRQRRKMFPRRPCLFGFLPLCALLCISAARI